jgi:hypothetical protein
MTYNKKTRTPYKKLYIKGKYEDFNDFYSINKENIYKKIIETFEGFIGNKKRVLSFYIQAIINGVEWDTEFIFKRTDTESLKTDVLPYFENKEDYETCQQIINLSEELTNKKELVKL